MDFKKLADEAKAAIDKRGGMDSLKADAEELKPSRPLRGSMAESVDAADCQSVVRFVRTSGFDSQWAGGHLLRPCRADGPGASSVGASAQRRPSGRH